MQTALVMTRAGPRLTGLIKLLVPPGGGKRDGGVTSVDEWSDAVKESIKTILIFEVVRQANFRLYDILNERKDGIKMVPSRNL